MSLLEIIGQIAVPALALIVSGVSFYLTNRMNRKVNRKDYEISENLKYELLRLIAALRSLDAKAVLSPHLKGKMDYSQEIKVISELRVSPGYLVFLHFITNDDDRFWIDFNIHFLSVEGNNMSMKDIRKFSNRIINILKNKTDLKGILDLEVLDLMKEICDMKGTAPQYEEEKVEDKEPPIFDSFINYLVSNGNSDPDVKVWYGVLYNNTEVLKQALDAGGNSKSTQQEIVDKYKSEFETFLQAVKLIR
jgi:hypothetical protein